MREGLVIKAKYGVFTVLDNGIEVSCKKRGSLNKDKKNIFVGDQVIYDENDLMISDIKERKTLLPRPSIANIDQILIIFSLVEPEFSYYLAFKYATYANKYGIECKIILTKKDKDNLEDKIKEIKEVFNKVGIEVYALSNKTKDGLDEVKTLFKNKISTLIGQSGVGKSSLLNAIDPSYQRSEGEYSVALNRGKHETKETILLPYQGGYIADTPGFSSLDLDLYKEDLAKFFPGFNKRSEDCYFTDCLHISEHKCKVKEDLEKGEIPDIAYQTYLKLSNDAIMYIRRYQR